MTISSLENLISAAERRAIVQGERQAFPRVCDLYHLVPSVSGKVELVYEGEQQGMANVARVLIGRAVKTVFKNYLPDPLSKKDLAVYQPILLWFSEGHRLELDNEMSFDKYFGALSAVPTLSDVAVKYMSVDPKQRRELATAMEFVLEGLHQNSSLSKDWIESKVSYKDMVGSMLGKINWEREE